MEISDNINAIRLKIMREDVNPGYINSPSYGEALNAEASDSLP